MTSFDDLGAQTATVVEQDRAQHNRRVDGAQHVRSGCLLRARPGSEGRSDGREQTTETWDLYAPAGFRAAATDQVFVEPGPTAADGTPARLAFDSAPQPRWDDEGAEDHVHAVVRRTTTEGDRRP